MNYMLDYIKQPNWLKIIILSIINEKYKKYECKSGILQI